MTAPVCSGPPCVGVWPTVPINEEPSTLPYALEQAPDMFQGLLVLRGSANHPRMHGFTRILD